MDPLSWIAALLLAALFFTSGWHKLRTPIYYQALIQKYLPVSPGIAAAAQTLLGITELLLAAALLFPLMRVTAAGMAFALLGAYLLMMGIALVRGVDMDCGCSGPMARQKLGAWMLLRNLLLMAVATVLLVPPLDRALTATDLLLVMTAAITAALFYVTAEQLFANHNRLQQLRGR